MKKKKLLYFMPDNPVFGKAGNLTRARKMLDYFVSLGEEYEVDFLSVGDWWAEGQEEKEGMALFSSIYPSVNFFSINRKGTTQQLWRVWLEYRIPNLPYKLFRKPTVDITNPMMRRRVRRFFRGRDYDVIVVSYASWARILDGYTGRRAYLVLDTHDFLTAHHREKRNILGKLFQSEMAMLNRFDEILTYSVEEEYVFGQFSNTKVTLLPVSFPFRGEEQTSAMRDIVYVASDNLHNTKSMHWFIEEVLPHLGDCVVHVVGKICGKLPEHPRLVKHGMVESLDEYYRNAKIAICPMLSGTGVKIKVLEALSYGLPVVTTRRGVDGLINKTNNGCLVAKDASDFARQITMLMEDRVFYEEIKHQAKTYFLENHTPAHEKKVLDAIFLATRSL